MDHHGPGGHRRGGHRGVDVVTLKLEATVADLDALAGLAQGRGHRGGPKTRSAAAQLDMPHMTDEERYQGVPQ